MGERETREFDYWLFGSLFLMVERLNEPGVNEEIRLILCGKGLSKKKNYPFRIVNIEK